MRTVIAIVVNIGLGSALGAFLYTMLPFAEGVACDATKLQGLQCAEPLGVMSRSAIGLAPVAVAAALSAVAYRYRVHKPWLTALFLSVLPVSIAIWIGKLWIH